MGEVHKIEALMSNRMDHWA